MYRRVYLSMFLLIAMSSGCHFATRSDHRHSTDNLFSALRVFVEADPMTLDEENIWPKPRKPDTSLYQYALNDYAFDARVRNLLAKYFLKYDAALLRKGLFCAAAESGTLIRLMQEQETLLNHFPGENISATSMRMHISRHRGWFARDNELTAEIVANDQAFLELSKTWKEATSNVSE